MPMPTTPLAPEEEAHVRRGLTTIGDMLQSDAFKAWNGAFMRDHCASFEDAEENKLEHTDLHRKYQEGVEARIAAAVESTDVDLAALMDHLPAFMQSGNTAQAGLAVHEAIETLTSLTDFEAFKAAMLVAKRDTDGTGAAPKAVLGDATAGSSDLEPLVAFVQAIDADEEGWTDLVAKPWFTLSKKTLPAATGKHGGSGGGANMISRSVVDMDLPPDQTVRMLTSWGDERRAWDDTMHSAEVLHTFPEPPGGGHDVVLKFKVKMPYFLRLAGIPEEYVLRSLVRKDQPHQGEYTLVSAPWDMARGALDESNSSFQVALGVARPHPDDAKRTRYSGMKQSAASKVPDWLMGWLAGTWAPKRFASMVDNYKRALNKRESAGGAGVSASC